MPVTIAQLIDQHCQRYPALEPRDIYKLLHQGLRGPEHLVASPDDFARRLQAEVQSVDADDHELLWEAIRPDGQLGRVHLRRFKAESGDLAALTQACLMTARQNWGTTEQVQATWAVFVTACRTGRWAFPLAQVLDLTRWLEERGYPSVHHSAAYRSAYHPAYRLLGRVWLDRLS